CVRLAKLDPGDLGDRVRFVRWLQWTAQQRAFRNRLWRQLRINAGASEKEQFADAALRGGANNVVLNAQILEQKLHRIIIVCLYPPHFCRRENHDVRVRSEEHTSELQ